MPNWCECDMTVTGEPGCNRMARGEAIEQFFRTELKAYDEKGEP